MKAFKKTFVVIAALIGHFTFAQQLIINSNVTEQELIENHLIQGCIEVSNITSQINGSINGFSSFGYFERNNSNFPFENGIVLSTGNAESGGNSLNDNTLNEGETNWGTDTDLEAALGISNTLNATSIEFDFASVSNTIQFNYILASEEYFGNFPCEYSDGFAFLIKEAGTNNPYVNIALIPGTSTPVNTTTIRPEIVGFCPAQNESYFAGYSLGATNYNGQTTVLTATTTITPNVLYHIKLVIADQTDKNYDSAVFIQGNSFNAGIDLGNDITTCATDVTLNGDIQNPDASYSWYLNDGLINGENEPDLFVTQSGTYTVMIDIPLANTTCTIEDTVVVQLNATQAAGPVSDYQLCDDISGNGTETFDLSTKTAEVLASVPDSSYNISYHYSNNNAINNINPITAPIQNLASPQIIYVRIEDTLSGCLAYTHFNLIVNPLPNIITPTDLNICDDTVNDGFTQIDLTQKDDEITGSQAGLTVTYHYSPDDANTGNNPIASPYSNNSQTEQLFVRVTNAATGCASVTTLNIVVLNNPVINTDDLFIDACDPEHDGFAEFDLTSIINDILQGLTGVSVTFHENYNDAVSGANAIPNPADYNNTTIDEQIIYVRVVDDITGCATVRPLVIASNLLLSGSDTTAYTLCDTDNDGFEEFDLNAIAEHIINDLPDDITVTFYETEEDRDNQTNALDISVPYIPAQNPQILYFTISNPQCEEVSEIELILYPVTEFNSIGTVNYCDTDQDGFTSINLVEFTPLVTQGQAGYAVSYFLTEDDAGTNENSLPNFHENTSNPQTYYVRITSIQTGCASINSFEVNVIPAPETSTPNPIIICDNDQDGLYVIDLTTTISELVSDTTDRVITFHNTLSSAENNVDPITNASAYNANTQIIYARVENTVTGCFSIENIDITVNTLPVFQPVSNYRICEDISESDGIGDFIFATKDTEILNGQAGKQALYFLTQTDAQNRINSIDKNTAYQNISNPQTIFVRVENLTDEDCYGVSSFIIEVGTNPLFNPPTDWFVCDDISNDGAHTFDLNEKIAEISNGISDSLDITFYDSLANAQSGTNTLPLMHTNAFNPQQIYARIDNGTICYSITSFGLNVIQAPDANESQPMVQCDTNYDGIVTFNLTDALFDILDVRQNDIVISYFETETNLEAQTNAIPNPHAYQNTANPQTVFIRLTNTVSNCYLSIPLELQVNLPPEINDFQRVDICDNDTQSFNLTEVNTLIVDDTDNTVITYHNSASDALNNLNALDTNYTYQTNNDSIHIRIENTTTHCFTTYTFNLVVNTLPIAHTPNTMENCDDDYDGFYPFDLSQQTASILGSQNPNTFSVSYYPDNASASAGINPLDTAYSAYDGEIIFARIEHNQTGCYNITQFEAIVHPKPVLEIGNQVICLENLPLLVSANTNDAGDTYLWSTNAVTPEIEITQTGSYWVTVTTPNGCETTEVFEVTESEQATIEFTETIDFSDPNNITVTVSGIGNYYYSLDGGPPQESNVFVNVTLGYHTITVIDANGCLEVSKDVVVIDAPKFMTPNGDGYFDTWHISGVETLPGTVVYIFDRYGKTLARLTSTSAGWDGTYNGNLMPSTDYWFVADVKYGDRSFEVKGHFALKR